MSLSNNLHRVVIATVTCLIMPLYLLGQDLRYAPKAEGALIENNYYSLDYNTEHKQPNWVYYMLTKSHITGTAPRASNFKDCTRGSIASSFNKDYLKSGYDKGHLCPAADMKLSKEAMAETFQMWNISPQNPSLNRGRWSDLESTVRGYIKDEADTLFIVTGPVFTTNIGSIGEGKVTVPTLFYKVVYNPKRGSIGFLMPNQKLDSPLSSWQVSIDLIEAITGIDFYPQLPDELEDEIEAQVDWWE